MQTDPAVRIGSGRPIFEVPFDRASHVGQLTADLVMSSREQLDFDQVVPLRTVKETVL